MHLVQRTIDNINDYLTYHAFGNITWEKDKTKATVFDKEDAEELIDNIEAYGNLSKHVQFSVVEHSYRILFGHSYIAEVAFYHGGINKVTLCNELSLSFPYNQRMGEELIISLREEYNLVCRLVEIGELT